MNEGNLHPWIDPELEARIVALVLGEASDFEREDLERLVSGNAELGLFKKRIEAVHGMLRDVSSGEAQNKNDDWKLSAERRESLLSTLAGKSEANAAPSAAELQATTDKTNPFPWFGLLKIAALLAFLAVAAAALIPASSRLGPEYALVDRSDYSESLVESAPIDHFADFDAPLPVAVHSSAPKPQSATLSLAAIEDTINLDTGVTSDALGVIPSAAPSTSPATGERGYLAYQSTASESQGREGFDAMTRAGQVAGVAGADPDAYAYFGSRVMDREEALPSEAKIVAGKELQLLKKTRPTPSAAPAQPIPAIVTASSAADTALGSTLSELTREQEPLLSEAMPDSLPDLATIRATETPAPAPATTMPAVAGSVVVPSEPALNELSDLRALQEAPQPDNLAVNLDLAEVSPIADAAISSTIVVPMVEEIDAITDAQTLYRSAIIATAPAPAQSRFGLSAGEKAAPTAEKRPALGTGLRGAEQSIEQTGEALGRTEDYLTRQPAPTAAPAPASESRAKAIAGTDRITVDTKALADIELQRQAPVADHFAAPSADSAADGDTDAAELVLTESASTSGGLAYSKDKLNEIIIPVVNFRDTPLEDAIEFLKQKSAELDTLETDPSRRGIAMEIQDLTEDKEDLGQAVGESGGITLHLTNVSVAEALKYTTELAGKKYNIDADGIKVVPLSDVDLSSFGVIEPKLAPVSIDLGETLASEEPFSTFSLHVSDVSFKLAQAALAEGQWPDASRIRIEEFVNAFDYGDPMPSQRDKVACALEQSIHPFLQQRNLLRVSMRTAAAGRNATTPLRLTFLLDNSGSMERIDRQQTVQRAFALLADQLQPEDQVTVISFARQPRLLADRVSGTQRETLLGIVANLPSEGGTNLEAALELAFEKALEHRLDNAQNRIILLTDGAANLGDAQPESLAGLIDTMRDSGIAFDAAGIGADGLNDEILEALTRKGDGRYYLLDRPEDADAGFARQIAGALRPAAGNVKIQVEFNPQRVGRYKLLGFEKHRLDKEDFRNDAVDAAEMAAEEAGVAVYQFEPLPGGTGDVGSVSVRYQDLASGAMVEKRWPLPYEPNAPRLEDAAPSQRIAVAAATFAARLKGDPLGDAADLGQLTNTLSGLPDRYRNLERVRQLHEMIQQARQLAGE